MTPRRGTSVLTRWWLFQYALLALAIGRFSADGRDSQLTGKKWCNIGYWRTMTADDIDAPSMCKLAHALPLLTHTAPQTGIWPEASLRTACSLETESCHDANFCRQRWHRMLPLYMTTYGPTMATTLAAWQLSVCSSFCKIRTKPSNRHRLDIDPRIGSMYDRCRFDGLFFE